MKSVEFFFMYGQKSVKTLYNANFERVKKYDFKIKTLRRLKGYSFTEALLDDLDKVKRSSAEQESVIKDLDVYLRDTQQRINNIVDEGGLSSFSVELVNKVSDLVFLIREHYAKVKKTLTKEKSIPEHRPESDVLSYYHAFKKEVLSSKDVVDKSKIDDLKTVVDEVKGSLDIHKSLLEKEQDLSEEEILTLFDVSKWYLAKDESPVKLKVFYKNIIYIEELLVLLRKLVEAEYKVVYKWNHN